MTPEITLTTIAQYTEEGYGPRPAFASDGREWVAGLNMRRSGSSAKGGACGGCRG